MKRVTKNSKSKKNETNKFVKIIDLLIGIIFVVFTILLIINVIRLSDIENFIRFIVIVVLIIISVLLMVFRRKKAILCRIVMIVLSLVYLFLNYTFYKVYSSLDDITTKVEVKAICLVTYLEEVETIDDITDEDIAVLNSAMDSEFYGMAEDVVESKNLDNELVEYDDYFQIINALLNEEVKYAFLPENYNDIYNASSNGEEKEELGFKVLYTEQKVIKNQKTTTSTKALSEPFTILLMGTDVILDSYNADTLMLLTVNPKTMKVTMLSIPRDTYTTIACTGGKHKINSSGWYGDDCVVKTVEKYLDIDIDYYAKINFLGIVDLVDNLGGIDVDVPYAFCEQNSQRQFGDNMIYVDEGEQTLNGEQALALSRNRHYWTGMCPSKYTTDGDRSDITRGQNQQLVIKAILNKLMTVRDLSKFYDLLDTVSENMTTNMSRDTILSFYNIGKDMVKKLNTDSADEVINIDRLTFKSYSTDILISGVQLSMIVNYNESVEYISKEMKKNLGIIEDEVITSFSFDVNDEYDSDAVKYSKLTTDLELLPNFVGKTLNEAVNYCNRNGIKYESNVDDLDGIIVSQSIGANTDITTIGNKTISFGVESTFGDNTIDDVNDTDNDNSTEIDVPSNDEGSESDNSSENTQNSNQETTPSDEEILGSIIGDLGESNG